MTAEERLTELLNTEFIPNNTNVTIGMIREVLSSSDYATVRLTLDSAINLMKSDNNPINKAKGFDLDDALSAMLAGGVSLSQPDRQAMIDQLATIGKWPDSVRDAVKALGGTVKARWQIEGYPQAPTLESVTAELDKESLAQQWATLLNESINAAVANGDRAGLKAALQTAIEVL